MSLRDLTFDVLFISHSLVGPLMPTMLESAVTAMGGTGQIEAQIINGAPIIYNWGHSATAEGLIARGALPTGEYEGPVISEAVPLLNHPTWSETPVYVRKFCDLAVSNKPDVRVYMYKTWHSLHSGTGRAVQWDDEDQIPWRTRISSDLARWTGIVDEVNAELGLGEVPVRLVPAGQAMGLLDDRIEAGHVPGLSDISDVFADDIHLNAMGNYFITLVQFATIYGIDPDGLPPVLGIDPAPSPVLAEAQQNIAWEAVRTTTAGTLSGAPTQKTKETGPTRQTLIALRAASDPPHQHQAENNRFLKVSKYDARGNNPCDNIRYGRTYWIEPQYPILFVPVF